MHHIVATTDNDKTSDDEDECDETVSLDGSDSQFSSEDSDIDSTLCVNCGALLVIFQPFNK